MKRLGETDFLAGLMRADVVLGEDEDTGKVFVVFGRSTTKGIAGSARGMVCHVIRQPILQRSDELDALLVAVRLAKGYHEYEATDCGN